MTLPMGPAPSIPALPRVETVNTFAPVERAGPMLGPAQVEFLEGLADPRQQAIALDDHSVDDRQFLGGIYKRWHSRSLDIPVLPEAAVKLSAMLRTGDRPIGEYVGLIDGDPALSLEVLKTANSAFYAASSSTSSLQEAVGRIGFTRLQAILINTHMRAKVLKEGSFQGRAELLMDLGAAMGPLASRAMKGAGLPADLCFTRGMLMHVEHFVILGAIGDVSRDCKRPISPSTLAVHQAFDQYGPEIRDATAKKWELTDILIGRAGEEEPMQRYSSLRRALIYRWLGRPLPAMVDLDVDRLTEAMADIQPRV